MKKAILACAIALFTNALQARPAIKNQKVISSKGNDSYSSMDLTRDGGRIVGGYADYGKSGQKTENSRGFTDYWIVKLGTNRAIQWDKTIGGSNYDYLYKVKQTADDGYILAGGASSNISGEKTQNSNRNLDFWIVKLDAAGNIQWDNTISGEEKEWCTTIKEIKRKNYVAGGGSNSGISGDKTQNSKGGDDYWLVDLKYVKPDSITLTQSTPLKTAEPSAANTAFSIYPNPATTVLHIQNKNKATFILSDQSGKRIGSKTLDGNGDLNVVNLPAGTYYLTNTTKGAAQKVIIAK